MYKSYSLWQIVLMGLHKISVKILGPKQYPVFPKKYGDDHVSEIVGKAIDSSKPIMISRFGAVEISTMFNFLGVTNPHHSIISYIRDNEPQWWWNEGIRRCMTDNAGFFPSTDENLLRFGNLMIESMKHIDILTSWQNLEYRFRDYLNCKEFINYVQIDPFWAKIPWTYHLRGKKVLVVHPFADEIQHQYKENRENLFSNPMILPQFTLITLKAVQSIGGKSQFKDWFEALIFMEEEISKIDFDVCLLGCGAYGMPLAAYVKKMGKQAIHIGGSLQLLFGIRGSRWEDPNYGKDITNEYGRYPSLFNEYWIRPSANSQVQGAEKVDNGCYW